VRVVLRVISVVLLMLMATACGRDPATVSQRYLEAGDRYFQRGRYREAAIMYRNALKKDARCGVAYYRQAQIELKLENYGGAVRSLRRALELLPDGAERLDARVKLADLLVAYMENGRWDRELIREGDALAEELLVQNGFEARRLKGRLATIRARELAGRGSVSEADVEVRRAIAELRAADAIQPLEPGVVIPLARSLWVDHRAAEAERALLALIEKKTQVPAAYADLLRLYREQNRTADVERTLERAVEHNPAHHSFLVELATHYETMGRDDAVLRVLERLKSRAPEYPQAYEAAAGFYLRRGLADDAIRQYEEATRALPQQKAHYQRLTVDVLIARNRHEEAARLIDAILQENPRDADVLVRRATLWFEKGDIARSIAELEVVVQLAPSASSAHYNLGRALAADGRTEEARLRYREALRLQPDFTPARVRLAQIELEAGEYGRALAAADDLLAADKGSQTAHLIRARALRGLTRLEEAREALAVPLRDHPDSHEALYELGMLYMAAQRLREAEATFRRAYHANRGNLRGLMALVEIRLGHNQAAALQLLEREVRRDPGRPELRAALADVAVRVGRNEVARREYSRLLERKGLSPREEGDLHSRLGEACRRAGDFQAALQHLEQARRLWPRSTAVLHNLALVYDELGRTQDAVGVYEECLRLDGDDPVALNNLAFHLAENRGDLDRALTLAQRARQKMPSQLEFADTLGWIYLKKQLTDQALEIFQDLVARKPDAPSFRYHLGVALLEKGQRAQAREVLLGALAARPSPETAGKIKALLGQAGS